MPRPKKVVEQINQDLVAPIESVNESPEVKTEIHAVVEPLNPCWNCKEHMTGSVCQSCGFDKSLLFNLSLEAEKAVEKQIAQKQEATK